MALKQKKKVIDGVTYLVTTMTAIKALQIQAKMIKILGPGILGLKTENVDKLISIKDGKVDAEGIVELLKPLLENFDDTEVVDFILSLFERGIMYEKKLDQGQIVPQPVDFDEHFTGRIGTMWKVVGFIISTNFSLGELNLSSLPTTEPPDQTTGN